MTRTSRLRSRNDNGPPRAQAPQAILVTWSWKSRVMPVSVGLGVDVGVAEDADDERPAPLRVDLGHPYRCPPRYEWVAPAWLRDD